MGKKKVKTRLEQIAEVIEINALRIRLEIPNRKAARRIARKELELARDILQSEIKDLV